uniref:Cyclin-dependent kinase inhibitor domain-containing protein n=1 Tax=Panagrolaimus sp. JU765 TaxID=591449 RepID=A0AC34R4R7_9BILA
MSKAAVLSFAHSLATSTPKPRLPVKRALFGANSAAAKIVNDTFCQQRLKEILDKKMKQWDFDFHQGVPMPSSSNFQYEAVPSDSVPKFYRSTSVKRRVSDVSTVSTTSSNDENLELDSLLDENMEVEEMKDVLLLQKKAEQTPKKMRQNQSKMQGFFHVQKQRITVKKTISGSFRRSIRQSTTSR